MCGRFTQTLPPEQMVEIFRITGHMIPLRLEYDVRPSTRVPSVRLDVHGKRELAALPWMWIHPRFRHCNAKGENVRRYPAYLESFARRRCLVPVTGYYEWTPIPRTKLKQRYYIERADGKPLAFAGVFNEDASMMATITMPAKEEISEIHDRTPVFIEETNWERYLALDPLTDDEKHMMISTSPVGTFRFWPVANNAVGPDLLKEVDPLVVPPADAPLPTQPKGRPLVEGSVQDDLFK